VLWETDGLTPGEVAGRLHVATPTVVKSANRMTAAGLLIRKRDPADARLVRLFLTDRARGVRRAVEQERDELERRMTATLTPDEREHLRSALIKIIAQLADSRGPTGAGGPAAAGGQADARGPESPGPVSPGPESPGLADARGRLGGTAGPAPGVRAGVERATGQRRAVQPG
jgi:MarR family transcriptional regulator for hemolysin